MRPIFIPDPHILSNIYWKFHIIFLIVKLSSKFRKFWYQIDEIGSIFAPAWILENFENRIHVYTSFCTEYME